MAARVDDGDSEEKEDVVWSLGESQERIVTVASGDGFSREIEWREGAANDALLL